MTKIEILEQIGRLPVVEQVQLAESMLHELGDRLRQMTPPTRQDQEALNKQMIEAAQEAESYYRSDPDVQLWTG